MSDRFKFRVWNEKERRYVELAFFVSSEGTLYIHFPLYMIAYSNPYTIEQCTGKEDKNKRLMYGGDLVRCANGTVAPIIWDQDRCAFLIDTKPYKTEISGLEEIVGNVHEVRHE